jgi:lysophospholipase L1-like esterase
LSRTSDAVVLFVAAFAICFVIFALHVNYNNAAATANEAAVNTNSVTGFVAHSLYPGFSAPEQGFTFNNNSRALSVADTAIYKTGYYSINGSQWTSFTLSGTQYGTSSVWLTGTATKTLPSFGAGEHYIIIYSCKYNNKWNCSDNRWQLIIVNNNPGKTKKIFIIGDSTAATYDPSIEPTIGWGMEMQQFFDSSNVVVVNNAISGESSMSYYESDYWTETKNAMSSGDYLFIQFGHNDEHDYDPSHYTIPYDTYQYYLKLFVDAARAKGVNPVLITPVERNLWYSDGSLDYSHGDYPPAMIALAQENDVPLIDLTSKSRDLYLELGKNYLTNYYFLSGDPTHFTLLGANETAKLVIEGIKELGSSTGLVQYIKGATPNPTCTPNTKECVSSSVFRQCNSAGTAWTNTNCPSSQTCSGAGICSASPPPDSTDLGICLSNGYNCGTRTISGSSRNCGVCPSGSGLTCNSNNLCVSATGKTLYVAPTANGGNDNNPGTFSQPFFTLNQAWSVVSAGDIIYVRGGTYRYGDTFTTFSGRSGQSGKMINIWNYPGEKPIINYSSGSFPSQQAGISITSANYIYLKGIRITGIAMVTDWNHYGMILWHDVSNCIFEQMETDHIGGWGVTIGDNCNNNLFLNCDSHHNQDPFSTEPYGGADGFQSYSASSTNIIFRGCRSWANSDDGWDLRGADGLYTLENCWSFWNGYIPSTVGSSWIKGGDGEGFKLTGSRVASTTAIRRIAKNCLAFENGLSAFDGADAPYGVGKEVYNCVAYGNKEGFNFDYNYGSGLLKNNIAYKNGNPKPETPANNDNFRDGSTCNHDYNSFDSSVIVSDADFLSVNSAGMDGSRGADGSLPKLDFLHLAPGSDLIDNGTNVGLSYNGKAPDLGAFER